MTNVCSASNNCFTQILSLDTDAQNLLSQRINSSTSARSLNLDNSASLPSSTPINLTIYEVIYCLLCIGIDFELFRRVHPYLNLRIQHLIVHIFTHYQLGFSTVQCARVMNRLVCLIIESNRV